MSANTVRTIIGFLKAVLKRRIPVLARNRSVEGIYNYLPIEGLYATSGQPNEAQFELIRDAGYERVINLAPSSRLENAVIDEANILQRLGLEYVHIPVDFKAPTDQDFERFKANLDPATKTWVHCAANMRVSAFTYRYRVNALGHEETVARSDLARIWEPFGVWVDFVRRS